MDAPTAGAFRRIAEALRALLGLLPSVTKTDAQLEQAVPISHGTPFIIGPTWTWIEKQRAGGAGPIVVEPRWVGTRRRHEQDGTVVDVIKTNDGRQIVVDCLARTGRDLRQDTLTSRRWAAAWFVKTRHDAGERAWELGPAVVDVASRADLAQAYAWALAVPGSDGIVIKLAGPSQAGRSARWIELRKSQPTAEDVHVPATAPDLKRRANQEDEDEQIRKNRETAAARVPHPFTAAGWTHKNGHPRCVVCGDEETVDKLCAGYKPVQKDNLGEQDEVMGAVTADRCRDCGETMLHQPVKTNGVERDRHSCSNPECQNYRPNDLALLQRTASIGKGIRVLKRDAPRRVILGVVHQPEVEDLQGDIISEADIEAAAYRFLVDYKKGTAGLNLEHKHPLGDQAELVEHYLAPVAFDVPQADGGREHVLKGSWLQAWRLSPELWAKVESGEYTGFSMAGEGMREELRKRADPAAPATEHHHHVHIHPRGGKAVLRRGGQIIAELERVEDSPGGP